MEEGLKIELKDLNSKSRKGLYYYIKLDGFKGDYYKYNDAYSVDSYVEFYKDKHVYKKKKGSLQAYQRYFQQDTENKSDFKTNTELQKRVKSYYKKVDSQPRVQSSIKKGITKNVIPNLFTSSNDAAVESTKAILKPLVRDTRLLSLLATDENVKKVK